MRKKILAIVLAAAMAGTAGCGTAKTQETLAATAAEKTAAVSKPEETQAEEEKDAQQDTGDGSPWIDSDLKANITEDMKLSLKEDFHLYVNHDWLSRTDIPEGYSHTAPFLDVALDIKDKARAALEDKSIDGHEAALSRGLYETWLNWDERNELGVEPMMAAVKEIQSISTMEELTDFICDTEKNWEIATFVDFENTPDLEDASSYVVGVWTDGFFLGDAAEYKNRSEYGSRRYESNKKLVSGMLQRAGYTQAEGESLFDRVIDFEAQLAGVSLTSEDSMDPDVYQKINHTYTLEELESLCSQFPLGKLTEASGYKEGKKFLVEQPDYLKKLDELYTEENLENIKSYMLAGWVAAMADSLDQEAFDLNLVCDKIQSGAEGRLEDEEYAFEAVQSTLTEPLEQTFLKKYDASKKKQDITRLCKDIIAVYREMLKEQEWMSQETKEKALEKLENIKINAVYPDKWYDYSGLHLDGLSYVECQKAISDFNRERDWKRTNQKVDRDEWTVDTLETNAYYNPQDNSINILLGILGGEFYREDMTREQLYGGTGIFIGHEISHAFDPTGAQFDKDGSLSNWWTDEDMAAFKARAEKLIAYYDTITAFGGQKVHGKNVQGEAIADMAGMKSILTLAEDTEGFDYDALFRQYATIWRELSNHEREYDSLNQDSHPLNYLRTNVTLQQFDKFYETYSIQPGDNMYLAPDDRVSVW